MDDLENLWEQPAATVTLTAGKHEWRRLRDLDGFECANCGLKVSMTRFPDARDGACDEWPVLDA